MRQPYSNLLLALLFGLAAFAAQATENYYRVEIRLPKDPQEILQLLSRLEVDHYQETDGSFQYILTKEKYELLKGLPVEQRLLSDKPLDEYHSENEAYLKNQNAVYSQERLAVEQVDQTLNNIIRTPAAFEVKGTLGGYYSFAENFRDKLQVSTNGTTWVEVPGRSTVKEPGAADGNTLNRKPSLTGISEYWIREIYDLSSYVGNKNLRLRLQFSSNGSSTYVYGMDAGFNIDDLVVFRGASAPAQQVITGSNQQQANLISWNTELTDAFTARSFIVERSANGLDFEPIGEVAAKGGTDYGFTDEAPFAGENYYRVLVQTEHPYRTLPVVLNSDKGRMPTGIVKLYPNPGRGPIQVQFQVSEPQADYIYRIHNSAGQLMLEQQITLGEGLNQLDIDAAGLAAGTYVFSILRTGRGTSYERSFIRQ